MIYLECYGDEALVKSLGATSKMIKHTFSKGEVCNMLRKDSNAIGIIDEDPYSGKPQYEKFMLDRVVFENSNLILCLDQSSKNRLVIIRPKLEDFVLKLADDCKVSDNRIPNTAKGLYDYLTLKRNTRKFEFFRDFIVQILEKDKTMKKLNEFLK